MSSRVFPDEGSRFAYRVDAGAVVSAAGAQLVVYANAGGTVRAAIRAHDGTATPGAAVPGSALEVDAASQVPLFWGPEGATTLWARASGGPLTPLYSRTDHTLADVNLALALAIAL